MKLKFDSLTMKALAVENSKGEELGLITLDDEWKCWIWEQNRDIKMSSSCLKQVTKKLDELDRIQ
jgi:hypothetical protein